MSVLLRILVVVALQTVALAYMIVDRQAMLNGSRTVTLKVIPVDPRDMFRGDYVILRYSISDLDLSKLDGEDKFEYADPIFVTLEQKGEEWAAVAVARGRPFATQRGVFIKGKVNTVTTETAGTWLSVDYGIESYFVPEGTGREIEQQRQKGDLSADIALDPQGRGAIKAMRRGGQVFYVEGIF
ncbi:MAG: GDYXXLXY domain-containing protein [Alphaproteobacteria bacterium]|nr:GDYXXLXY domain-containing protein [Alphaproteobacteria bacterium]